MATKEEIAQMVNEAIAESLEEQNQSLKEQNEIYQEKLNSIDEIVKAEERRRELLEKEWELSEKMATASKKQKRTIDERITAHKEEREEIEKTYGVRQDKEYEALKSYRKSIEVGKRSMSELLAKIGINNEWDDSFFGKMEHAMRQGNLRGHLAGFGDELAELPQKVGGSMMMKAYRETISLAKAQDTATSALSKATGAGDKYDQTIQDVYMSNRRFGASFDDANNAISSMYSQVPKFDTISQGTRDSLAETSILLEKLGVSGDTSAGIVSHMTTTMALSADQAIKYTKELAGLSGAGMDLQKVYGDYMQVANRLATYTGPKSIEVFQKLGKVAKATASDVSTLLDVAEQFDTFDRAAEVAGRFNALLGGNFIDPTALVNMEDMGDRINYIVGLRDKAGVMWETLSRYERLSLASSLGMEVDQLGKLWTMSRGEMEASAEAAEKLEKRAQAAVSVQEKWTSVQQTFAIAMGPAIDLLAKASEWYLQLDKDTQELIGGTTALGIGIAALAAPIVKMTTTLAAVAIQAGATVTANTAIAASSGPAAAGITTIGSAANKAGPGLLKLSGFALALGGAFGLAGAGMYGFGTGVSKIFDSLNEEKVDALGQLFLNVSSFAPLAMFAIPATIGFTAALAGMSKVVDEFDAGKLASLAEMTSNFSDLKKDNVEIYTRAVRETTQLYKAAKDSGVSNPIPNVQQQASSQNYSVPFVIKLNERELNNFVVEIVKGEVGILARD